MKVKVRKDVLVDMVKRIGNGVCKLIAEGDKLFLVWESGRIFAKQWIEGDVEESGFVDVYKEDFEVILKGIVNDNVILTEKELIVGDDIYELPVARIDIKEEDVESYRFKVQVKAFDLLMGLKRTLPFVDKKSKFIEFDVICFKFLEELELVASDNTRLALYRLPYVGEIEKEEKFLLYYKDAEILMKFLDKDEWITIHLDNLKMMFEGMNWYLRSGFYRDTYPDYTKLINDFSEGVYVYEVAKVEFLKLLKQLVMPIKCKESRVVCLQFGNGKCVMKIDKSGVNVKREIQVKGDKEFSVYMHADFLIEGLKMFDGKNLVLRFHGSDMPLCIKENKYLLFIMPAPMK